MMKPDDVLTTLEVALSWIESHFRADTAMCQQNMQHFVEYAKDILEQERRKKKK